MRLALLFVCAAGCAEQSPRVDTSRKLVAVDAPRTRLGWVTWDTPDEVYVCTRRVDDAGNTVGVMGPCNKIGTDGVAHSIISWLNADAPDRSPSNASPFPAGCKLILEDGHLSPDKRPARLILVTPSGRQVLDEWTPDDKLEGDVFPVEASFSPDGDRLASLHLAVGLGEGERIIAVVGAKLITTPKCE